MDVVLRALRADESEHVRWALFEAVTWDTERELPPFAVTIEHPELARYHRQWGRPGDLGVVAERGDEVVGVALARLFTEDDHGHGYVDDETPELAVAVADGARGNGVGTRLLNELVAAARGAGIRRLSPAGNGLKTRFGRLSRKAVCLRHRWPAPRDRRP